MQGRAAGDQHPQRRQVVAARADRVEDRARERVAYDQERAHLLALDGGEDVVGVEPKRIALDHHAVAAVELAEGGPVRRAVHERGGGQAA